ncbi:Uncharacterised protein [Candidatus Burarchaeum australiense]|nr:Uncharacterised protein [Candidatus Burarchaeum australiense]
MEAFYVISAIGLAYALISIAITKRFGNRERVQQIQKEMQEITKKQQDAIKNGNEKDMDRANSDSGRIPALLKESMILQFKPLIFLLPFLLILPAIAKWLYPDFIITLPFQLPIFIQHFERFPNWRAEFGAVGWFWLAFLFSSLLAQGIVGQMQKRTANKAKEKAAASAPASSDSAPGQAAPTETDAQPKQA